MQWQANVFSLFPEAFPGNLGVSIIGSALSDGKWRLNVIDLKKFPTKSDRVDFKPYGGGVGMVLSPISFAAAFQILSEKERQMKRIYFSPRGRKMTQRDLKDLSEQSGITVLCGRYEGVDQRIIDYYGFEEVSIGDFVLLGGEAAAMVIIEGIVRLLPAVVGNGDSINTDSFRESLLEHDQYTRPREFHGMRVPEVLLSGNHEKIALFRSEQSKRLTRQRRPDIWDKYVSEQLLRNRKG